MALFVFTSLRPVGVSATVNQTINFQSKIVNKTTGLNLEAGTPACVKSGADTCDFQIRIWNDVSATSTTSGTGNLMFTQTFQDVEIGDANGLFNLAVNSCGSAQSGNSEWGTSTGTCTVVDDSDADTDAGVNFDRSDLFVEVSFAPTDTSGSLGTFSEVFSRQPFRSVPSAFHAQNSSQLEGIGADGFVQFGPSSAQTTSTNTNSLINLTTTATSTNALITVNENGAGTPDLLTLKVAGTNRVQVTNDGVFKLNGAANANNVIDATGTYSTASGSNSAFKMTANQTAATSGSIDGIQLYPTSSAASGTVAGMNGMLLRPTTSGGNTVTAASGVAIWPNVGTGTTISTFRNIWALNPGGSGSVGTLYGLYTDNLSNATNSYGVYVVGAKTVSIFAATGNAATKAMVLQGAASQSANLLELQTNTTGLLSFFDASGNLSVGTTTSTAILNAGASTTARASLRLISSAGTNPSAPNSGDLWWNGTSLNFYNGSATTDILAGATLLTDGGATTYRTDTADDFAIGGTSLVSPFSVDVSLNTTRLGSGSGTSAVLNMYASNGATGSVTYGTTDGWAFSGGTIGIWDAAPSSTSYLAISNGTNPQASGNLDAISVSAQNTGTGTTNGILGAVTTGSSNATGAISGVTGTVTYSSSATPTNIISGVKGTVTSSGGASMGYLIGGYFTNTNSNGTVTTADAGIYVTNVNSSTVSGYSYGIYAQNNNAATAANTFGGSFVLNNQIGATATLLKSVSAGGSNVGTATSLVGVDATSSNQGSLTYLLGINNTTTNTSSGTVSSRVRGAQLVTDNSASVPILNGIYNETNNLLGTATLVYGQHGYTNNLATTQTLRGAELEVYNNGTISSGGEFTFMKLEGDNGFTSTGTVDGNWNGLYLDFDNITGSSVTGDIRGTYTTITNAGTVANIYGSYYNFTPTVQATTSGYGIYLDTVDTGAVNNYGIYISGAGTGSTLNRAIFVNSGTSQFGGQAVTSSADVLIAPNNPTRSTGTANGGLYLATSTFTDNSTSASGTAAIFAYSNITAPTLAATNATVTTTEAATFYVSGAPTAGTNMTITNALALYVASGSTKLGGRAVTSSADLIIAPSNASRTAGLTNGGLYLTTSTITDSSTAGSGTSASFAYANFTAPTLAAANTSVTTTDAATVYISGAPTAGTNMTVTNAMALYVAAGTSKFGGDIVAATAPSVTTTTTTATAVDTTNSVGQYVSAKIAPDGFGAASYYDATNGDLRYTHCTDISCSAHNSVTVDNSANDVGQHTSLAFGTDGFPVISYYDLTNTALKVAKCSDVDCTAAATITTVDNTATSTGTYTSIAIGVDGFPIIAYYDSTAANLNLKVAHCTTASCSTSTISNAEATNNVGLYTAIAIEADGYPIIAFNDVTSTSVRILKCTNLNCSAGTSSVLDNTGTSTGQFNSIIIGSDGFPIVSYYDVTNANLRMNRCANMSCTTSSANNVDASANNVGGFNSIAVAADGMPIISYNDTTNGDLWVAKCALLDCSAGTKLTNVEATNTVGQFTGMIVPADGLPLIFHYDATGGNLDLRTFKCASPDCSATSFSTLAGGSNLGSRTNYFNQVYANSFNGKELNISNFDLAEEYVVEDTSIEAGDLVRFKQDSANKLVLERAGGANTAYDKNVVGVISTDPGLYLKEWQTETVNGRPLALAGRVPVKVTTENGPIKRGDYLTSSSKAGYAMKANDGGMIVGRALEDFPAAVDATSADSALVQQKLADVQKESQDIINTMVDDGALTAAQKDEAAKAVADAVNTDTVDPKSTTEGRIMMFVSLGYMSEGLVSPKPVLQASDVFTSNEDKTEFTINKLLTVKSTLASSKFTSLKGADLVLQVVSQANAFKVLNPAGDTLFGIDNNGKVSFKMGDNSSVGAISVPAGKTEVSVSNTGVTAQSQIHMTVDQFVFARVKAIVPGVGFTLEIQTPTSAPTTSDVKVNYFIIN